MTYNYYHDGQSVVEEQDGSGDTIKQYVWGTQYIDELVQTGLNDDPTDANENDCETFYWGCQDANFNLLGIVDSNGDLKERYEYTPYGQRTVYRSAGSDDALCMSPILESQRVLVSGIAQAYGICDVGHQGLLFDKEFGFYYNRARKKNRLATRLMHPSPAMTNHHSPRTDHRLASSVISMAASGHIRTQLRQPEHSLSSCVTSTGWMPRALSLVVSSSRCLGQTLTQSRQPLQKSARTLTVGIMHS